MNDALTLQQAREVIENINEANDREDLAYRRGLARGYVAALFAEIRISDTEFQNMSRYIDQVSESVYAKLR